jgi:hypothetical protein
MAPSAASRVPKHKTSDRPQSRSIRYRLGIAGLPEMKDLDSFRFDLSPVNG